MEVVIFSTFSTVMEVTALWVNFMYKCLVYFNSIIDIDIWWMEGDKREPVVLYQVPLLPELQVKSLIINSFPQLGLTLQHIQLRKKEGKFQAFLMVPSQEVANLCSQKELKVGKEKVYIKKWNTQAQVFIGRLPDSLPVEDIRTYLQTEFGRITRAIEGQPHEESKIKLRHCYIQFEKEQDAEKCIFSNKKISVKGHELRPSRTYAWNQSEQTDKKVWMKIVSQVDDQDQLERVLNQQFRKEGKLRQKIRVQGNKAIIQYTSSEGTDRVLQVFKNGKVGKYEVVLRPYATKDSYTAFVGGLKSSTTAQQLENAFKHYQPLVSCCILSGRDSTMKNATLTFGSQQTFKRVLVEYQQDQKIKHLFIKNPYLTLHMNSKERNDYLNYRKGKEASKPPPKPLFPNPVNYMPYHPIFTNVAPPPIGPVPPLAMPPVPLALPMQPIPMQPLPILGHGSYGRQMGGFNFNPQSNLQ